MGFLDRLKKKKEGQQTQESSEKRMKRYTSDGKPIE